MKTQESDVTGGITPLSDRLAFFDVNDERMG